MIRSAVALLFAGGVLAGMERWVLAIPIIILSLLLVIAKLRLEREWPDSKGD